MDAEQHKLVIVGAGQLGYLLCEAAESLGVVTTVVSPDPAAPATLVANQVIVSSFDADGLAEKIAACGRFVTFELEDIPDKLLDELAEQEQLGRVVVNPSTQLLALAKNKARQKAWLMDNDFPTLPYIAVAAPETIVRDPALAPKLPCVQKAQTGGYDGYGVQIIRTQTELANAWPVPSIFETYLENPVELAVIVARAASGETSVYDPVRLCFDPAANILDVVYSPSGLSASIEERARSLAEQLVAKLDGVGIYAIEMFVDERNDQIFINELSPRVHNSGHHTIEACQASQFEQHVRAVCNLPLHPAQHESHAVMRNLLYSDSLKSLLSRPPGRIDTGDPLVYFHWYGKQTARPGRKMGHITCLEENGEVAASRIAATLAKITGESGEVIN